MKKIIAAGGFAGSLTMTGLGAMAMAILLLATAGCQTTIDQALDTSNATGSNPTNHLAQPTNSEALILREGDILKISFSGSPNLNTSQQIRRDGKITLELVGEINAVGLTPSDLEKEISKTYGSQLVIKEVSVVVVSSSIPVFVTGAVLSPHKIMSDHPITVLEAVMEAGGPDYAKANLKDVRVIRYVDGREHTYILNLKDVLKGIQMQPFYLKPFDIIYIPERFSMF
jgi:polysaccharide biosynthesis/export protein